MKRKKKRLQKRRIFAFVLSLLFLLQTGTVYGIEGTVEQDAGETPYIEEKQSEDKSEGQAGSWGSYAGQPLRFVNLQWEREDLGEIVAVFDGEVSDAAIITMERQKRGVYETTIPEGDYSTVAFQKAGSEEVLPGSCYNFYGIGQDTDTVGTTTYEAHVNDTFYYDSGENPSYWGSDPDYEVSEASIRAEGPATGDMVYVIDVNEVEDAKNAAADQINIAFLKEEHDNPPKLENGEQGVAYTMYERKDGIYSAPFPENVDAYDEIAFQLIESEPSAGQEEPEWWLSRHYNFRGKAVGPDEVRGHFVYQKGLTDTFYLNEYEEGTAARDVSYWGAHPGRADDSLDTQVLYVDVTDFTGNNLIVDADDMWISWDDMKGTMVGGEYDKEKGYKIKNELPKANTRYFQFPYNSGLTENDVLTLQFSVKTADGTETPEEYRGKTYFYKFMLVPRSGKNCLQADNIWEFNGQIWTTFQIGEIEERTLFFSNAKTKYEEILMRPFIKNGENWQSVNKEELQTIFGFEPEEAEKYVVELADGTTWLKLDKESEPNKYNKVDLYKMTIPSVFTHVQFRGKKGETYYYSNREAISESVSYPCYYASQNGAGMASVPDEDVENPGITGFWRSVYSADTSGDQSINIPEDTFVREEGTYYADATFYDYYSDWEMSGKKQKDQAEYYPQEKYAKQADIFNTVLSAYYKENYLASERPVDNTITPLYLMSENAAAGKWQANTDLHQNKWTGTDQGPRMGIVDKKLEGGQLTSGATSEYNGVVVPLFDEEFLRGENSINTAVGNVYKNVRFPFTIDERKDSKTYGYWVFDSAQSEDAVRMSYDVDEGYFLKRTNEPIMFRGKNSFFPFNSPSDYNRTEADPWNEERDRAKTNCLFGTKFNLEFSLTDDGKIYNEYTGNEEPIRFEFQGDDDAWIFIDGVLALDLGGIHDAVRGEIDFRDKTYTIWRALKDGNTYDGKGTVVSGHERVKLPQEVINSLKDPNKTHTLTMFYMERGLYESNLKLSFNFPRRNTFSVDETVDVTSNRNPQGEDIFTDLLDGIGSFQFDLKNLVTSGGKLPVDQSAGYIEPGERIVLYNSGTDAKFSFGKDKGTVEKTDSGYEAVQKSQVSGIKPNLEDMLKITPADGQTLDVENASYLRLAMTNLGANDANARNIYLSFVDKDNNRVGDYAARLGYDGENPTFVIDEDSVLRIDYRKMRGDEAFDWANVKEMYIGIRRQSENDAAKYTVSSIAFIESVNEIQSLGFTVSDNQISDYGSFESGELSPVDGAWYVRKNQKSDGSYDVGVSRQMDNGTFSLADGQKAVFSDKFRTGSYLALTEPGVDADVFDTKWTILENGKPVEAKYLLTTRDDVTTVENPFDMIVGEDRYPLSGSDGMSIKDGRKEKISEGWQNKEEIERIDPNKESTIVYRSYIDPDSTSNMATDLGVSVKNILKYGTITIKKQLAETMKDPTTEKYIPGEYTFVIRYTNIAGKGLESQLEPIDGKQYLEQEVTVKVDENTGKGEVTIPNIPAGTTYQITERPSNGANLKKIEIGTKILHQDVGVHGVTTDSDGKEDYSQAYVEGTAYASDQTFTFTNEVTPFYMDIEKVWRDDLTEEERAELGIEEVRIRLQRREYGSENEQDWQTVTKDYFGDEFVEEGTDYVKLTAENDWKAESTKVLPIGYQDGSTTKRYEYRIQELNEDGKLDNYEVTYDEIRNPDKEVNGDKYLHVTYRAINTPVKLNIVKKWSDAENVTGVRPEKIRVKLVGSSEWNPEDPGKEITWKCYRALKDETHECDDSCYIELTAGAAWKKSVDSLAIADDNGKEYYYKLSDEQIFRPNEDGSEEWIDIEDDVNEYETTYSEPVLPQSDNSAVISVENKLDHGHISIIKKDSETAKNLEGAEFKLERLIPEGNKEDEQLNVDSVFGERTGTTSKDGEIEFRNLPYGKYKITEIKAPQGYLLLKNPIYITLDEKAFEEQKEQHKDDVTYNPANKTITVTIYNEKGLSIPTTGGRGILKFTMAGILLLGIAALLYKNRSKKS